MKVKIGPYLHWWGPYQIAELIFGNPDKNRFEMDYKPTWRERGADKLGDWLASTWVADFCQWIHDRRQRQVYVHIDNYDVWNMDDTLRHIIGPMFVRLKAIKHGSGNIEDCDVPDDLKSTAPGARDGREEWDSDHNLHKRYDWLLDEMIWAFTTDHEEVKSTFYDHSAVDESAEIGEQIKKIKVDWEAVKAYNERLQKAYCLFGKYYQTFWD